MSLVIAIGKCCVCDKWHCHITTKVNIGCNKYLTDLEKKLMNFNNGQNKEFLDNARRRLKGEVYK